MLSLDDHGALNAASAMAFDAFLSLIPLVAFAGYVLSRVHQSSTMVFEPLIRAAPPGVAQAVTAEFARMSESPAVAPIGITGFLWLSSSGVSTAMGVFGTMYAAKARPWYVQRAIATGCVLASLAIVPMGAFLGVLIGTLSGSIGARLVAFTLPETLIVLLVAGFFKIAIQQPDVERRRIFPGAITTVVLWTLVSALFSLYVTTLARYATFYGNLATTAIFLFWLWLLSLALLVGGEVNARLERERRGLTSVSPPRESSPPDAHAIPLAPALPVEAADGQEAAREEIPRAPAWSVEVSVGQEAAREEETPPKKPAASIETTMRSRGVAPKRAEPPTPGSAEGAVGEGAVGEGAGQRGAPRDPKSLASSE